MQGTELAVRSQMPTQHRNVFYSVHCVTSYDFVLVSQLERGCVTVDRTCYICQYIVISLLAWYQQY